MVKSNCVKCGRIKTRFVSKKMQGGDLVSAISKATSDIKLPWAKFPGEMHLYKHNFTGPGTRLDERLNPDGTPKEWSQPINRVDQAAYRHDLAYAQHDDTKNRNIADRKMINELMSIPNPTRREKVERPIVTPIILLRKDLV